MNELFHLNNNLKMAYNEKVVAINLVVDYIVIKDFY